MGGSVSLSFNFFPPVEYNQTQRYIGNHIIFRGCSRILAATWKDIHRQGHGFSWGCSLCRYQQRCECAFLYHLDKSTVGPSPTNLLTPFKRDEMTGCGWIMMVQPWPGPIRGVAWRAKRETVSILLGARVSKRDIILDRLTVVWAASPPKESINKLFPLREFLEIPKTSA